MGKKNTIKPSTISKQAAMVLALVTFVVSFTAGVVFTVYKTKTAPGLASDSGQDNNYAQKARALETEAARNPQNPEAWIQLGHIYFDGDQYEKGIRAYEKSLALNPNNVNVLTDLGIMYRRNGQPKKAVAAFDQAIAVNPKHETARLNKGIVLLHDLKDRERALKAWEELLEINPLAIAGKDQRVDQLVKHYKEHVKDTSN